MFAVSGYASLIPAAKLRFCSPALKGLNNQVAQRAILLRLNVLNSQYVRGKEMAGK